MTLLLVLRVIALLLILVITVNQIVMHLMLKVLAAVKLSMHQERELLRSVKRYTYSYTVLYKLFAMMLMLS
jgi:hypothetical protein